MAKEKEAAPSPDVENPDVQAFLTDPKHEKERNFMTALIRKVQADDAEAARLKTKNVGGNFIDNLVNEITGGMFGGDK